MVKIGLCLFGFIIISVLTLFGFCSLVVAKKSDERVLNK